MRSVMDPYRRLRCFKKILDPYSLLVQFIWVPYGIRHGSVRRFCRFKKKWSYLVYYDIMTVLLHFLM